MRHQTNVGFAALMILALMAAGAVAVVARQRDHGNGAPTTGISGYTLTGTIGGPVIPTTPVDVAVDAGGRVFVADITLNRVLAFGPDGNLDESWGANGMSERLVFPAAMAIGPDGSLYVLQLGSTGVQVLDRDGHERDRWTIGGNQDLTGTGVATSIAVDHHGTVYIPDQRSQQIRRYTPDGDELDAWNIPLDRILPRDIVEWDGRIVLSYQDASGGSGGFLGFDVDGNEVPASGEPPATETFAPGSIAVGPEGGAAVLYLSGDEASPPVIGTDDGVWEPGGIPAMSPINGLVLPGIAWDENGRLLVADPSRQRVRIYNADGSVASDIQSPSNDGLLAGLDEITVGPDGLLYAADPLLGRVTAYRPEGEVEATFQLPGDDDAPLTTGFTRRRMRIAVDGSGSVYVVDEFTGRISKFNRDGDLIDEEWAGSGDPDQPLVAMMLAAGGDDHLYLVDIESQDRIRVFDTSGEDLGLLIEPFWDGAIQDIAITGGSVYTVELGAATSPVRAFSTSGDYVGELADLSHGRGNSNRTGFAIAVAPDGGLIVSAVNVTSGPEFEYQLLHLGADGDLDRLGILDVPFTTLPDVTVGPTGTLYLAAPNDQLIYVYEPVE